MGGRPSINVACVQWQLPIIVLTAFDCKWRYHVPILSFAHESYGKARLFHEIDLGYGGVASACLIFNLAL